MKPFTPHQTLGISPEKHETLFCSEEGSKGGFFTIDAEQARKKNDGEGRFGIFRAVNVFDYVVSQEQLHDDGKRTYRYEKNLLRLRACYNDLDLRKEGEAAIPDMPQRKETIKEALFALPCPPTFIVETKNGLQPWWVIDEEDGDVILDDGNQDMGKIALYRSINEGIIAMTGVIAEQCGLTVKQDPVKDVARVLRVPTFLHKKSEPFLCSLHLPQKRFSYPLAELAAAFPCKAIAAQKSSVTVSTEARPVNPTVDVINSLDVRKIVPILWTELRIDKHNFIDANSNEAIAMFVDREGRNIVHPGGGDRIAVPSGPFLLVRNKLFPVSTNRTKRRAAAETMEWFFENFDLEPRSPAYAWKVMEELVKDCWYGNVDGQPSVLFRHKNEKGEFKKWQPVAITESKILTANMGAWLHCRGYDVLIPATGRELEESERKDIHSSPEDYRKHAKESMCSNAVLGEPIKCYVRIAGDKHRIIIGDDTGFYEILPVAINRKQWGEERILMETNCRECEADLGAQVSALNDLIPLLSSFKSKEKGGRFLAAYGVLSMLPFIEIPPFLLLGDPRTAKTSKMRAITALADPNNTLEPRTVDATDSRNLIANLSHNWLITIDNKGNLTAGESDQICTLFSGGISIARTLHTNTGVTTRSLRRPCIISAIETPRGIKEDLWDRFIALESSLEGASLLGSDEFDSLLTTILPKARGAAFHLLSQLLAQGPIHDPDILTVARRKRTWAGYATRLYDLMGWDRGELRQMFEECNSFIQKSEQQVDSTLTCLRHVLDDLLSMNEGRIGSFAGWDFTEDGKKTGRVIIEESTNTVKIASTILIELLKAKAGQLHLHRLAIAQVPESPESLSKFMKKEKSLLSLGIIVEKYAHKKWRGWKLIGQEIDDEE